jgi:hypothetical protein
MGGNSSSSVGSVARTASSDLGWLDNKSLSVLTDDCFFSRELKLAWYSHGLIAPFLE